MTAADIHDFTPEERAEFENHCATLSDIGNMSRPEAEAEALGIIRGRRNGAHIDDIQRKQIREVARFTMPDPDYTQVFEAIEARVRDKMREKSVYEFHPTEEGQTEAVTLYIDGLIRYVEGLGWAAYDGQDGTWRTDIGEHVVNKIIQIVARERWDFRGADESRDYFRFVERLNTEPGVRHVEKMLRPHVMDKAEVYDKSPYVINCHGMAVDLRTGKYNASIPELRFMRTTGCQPDFDQLENPTGDHGCPHFIDFLADITCGDVDLALWIMRWFGYCLTGDISAPFFVDLHGKGRNGKGVLLHTMANIFGGYARTVPDELIIDDSRAGNVKHAYASLLGVRLAIADDVKPGRLNLSSLKKITGKDPVEAERKYQHPFTFWPTCKVTLASNHKLSLPETGDAATDRIKFVPFNFSAIGREDFTLEDKLIREAPQILAWIIREAGKYLAAPGKPGFPPCAAIDKATEDYIAGEDIIQQFLDEKMTMRDKDARIKASDLYKAYKEWAYESGEKRPMTTTAFGRRMSSKGMDKVHDVNGWWYMGIRAKGMYD
ncbi:phage/plasmid primase, P4 family [Treponema primitia]|uniref:DNA primase family protein n=1 Tax=Treponema primitia TaxID=88058 RepID=UPI0039804AEC